MNESFNLKVGDRFFTIAYTVNKRVIEVEVIDIDILDGVTHVHFQNIEHIFDRWDEPIELVKKWRFSTREDAENKLAELNNAN